MEKQIEAIIKEYCESYGINYKDLFENKVYKKPKYDKFFSFPFFKMSLGYYIYNTYPITLTRLAYILGYRDHSVMSYHRKIVKQYIDNEDEKFLSYYNRLVEIGKPYLPEEKILRPTKGYYIIQTKTDEHYG